MLESKITPQLSVVTINLNNAIGLGRTLAAAREQTSTCFEHVIIDGGSTDDSTEILASYSPSYSHRIVTEPDDGIFDAMNKGLYLSVGSLVVFMNSGDTFADAKTVEYVLADWAQHGWLWAFGDVNFCRSGGPVETVSRRPFDRRKIARGTSWVPHQSTYMSRDLLMSIGGFDDAFGAAADQGVILAAALRSQPRELPAVLSNFELGGAHSRVKMWEREYLYHLMRRRYGQLVGGNKVGEALFTAGSVCYRTTRRSASNLKSGLTNSKPS